MAAAPWVLKAGRRPPWLSASQRRVCAASIINPGRKRFPEIKNSEARPLGRASDCLPQNKVAGSTFPLGNHE